MIPIFTAFLVAVVNGLFLILAKSRFDRKIEVLRNDLSVLRDLTVKRFDRRADIYYDAIEPFIRLSVLTNFPNNLSQEEVKKFLETALLASARIQLFGSKTVHSRFCEMFDWTKNKLYGNQAKASSDSAKALDLARAFLDAAHDDLFLEPNSERSSRMISLKSPGRRKA